MTNNPDQSPNQSSQGLDGDISGFPRKSIPSSTTQHPCETCGHKTPAEGSALQSSN